MPPALKGVFPPIATVFDSADGRVDAAGIKANVTRLMTTGLAGVLALGSNGEAGLLDDDEADVVVTAAREATPSTKLFLVGVGRESTRATFMAARRAAELGADAVLVRPPSYYKSQMTPEALIAHFRAIADASPVPIVLYNLPGPTGITLTPAIIATLADHPNVAGMKETSAELERLGMCTPLRDGTFPVLSGWAPVLYPAMIAGASGGILAVANILPDECVRLFDLVRTGQHDAALSLQRWITPVARYVSSVYGVAGLKAAMDELGYRGGPVRMPLPPLAAGARDEIIHALRAFQVRQ